MKKQSIVHGGPRKGAGRKKVDDPALQINIYPRTSQVIKAGGVDEAKVIALKAIENAAKKNLKKS